MPQNIDFAIQILGIALILFFIFVVGIFTYKFSSSIDKSVIKDVGAFLYRLFCKSGFMVIIVVLITYFICKSEQDRKYSKNIHDESSEIHSVKANNGVHL